MRLFTVSVEIDERVAGWIEVLIGRVRLPRSKAARPSVEPELPPAKMKAPKPKSTPGKPGAGPPPADRQPPTLWVATDKPSVFRRRRGEISGRERVFKLVRRHGPIDYKRLSRLAGMHAKLASAHLSSLRTRGLVAPTEAPPAGGKTKRGP